MSKIYKGYELIKAIADGELKNGTKIIDNYGEYIYKINPITDTPTLYRNNTGVLVTPDYSYFVDDDNKFEILELEDEIDIQDIEELDEEIAYTNLDIATKWNQSEKKIVEQQNKILRAIKQLDNKINK